ncbi:cation:proton antiporter [Waterburya agarophytonicola K14]|uniref:Cation:proton antiporter n=1 Tax=Waterburya agarophytonicola KI4 TaxID=2874699 RepID=A0A964FG71_9CYAN|nr:cation:proton antiporter [Waterburya agarophytonicola]MCC0177867.1 cation:proton antiporter [Waterburya agarophytonicola KI4]
MEQYLSNSFQTNPLLTFTLLLLVVLTLPPIFERIKLPGLVGLLFAGVVLGSNGLGLLDAKSETMKLLSDIGKIYLMFVAGLEIDLEEFRKTKERSLGFGMATFLVPLIMGTAIARIFGIGWNASILIGSLLASHTLLGYPIVKGLGVVANEAVTVTIGATIFTDIAALLVLAICISIHGGEFSAVSLITQLVILGIYAALILIGFDKAGKEYFRRTGDEESNQFLFILLAVFLASVGAQIISVDKIVGAFLAGLAVNDVVGRSPVEEKIEFVGSTLFIPFFFVGMGLLLDIPGFIKTVTTELPLTLGIVGGLLLSKFIAAAIAKILYSYNWNQAMTMWSLSLPQVAATLAAALAGVNAELIDDSIFNVVIVLMLVTAIAGPILTTTFGRKLSATMVANGELQKYHLGGEQSDTQEDSVFFNNETRSEIPYTTKKFSFRVVVPVANPETERNLIEMGALLARHELGTVISLSIAKAHVHMDDPDLKQGMDSSRKLLKNAVAVTKEFGARGKSMIRIDDDVVQGITRAAREERANLIIMGWSQRDLRSRIFGTVVDGIFWSAHCPVAVMRLQQEPIKIHQVLVPIKNFDAQAKLTIEFAQLFAETNQAAITLLHVSQRKTPATEVEALGSQLKQFIEEIKVRVDVAVQTIRNDNTTEAILAQTKNHDLVILRSIRRRTAGGLAVSDISDRLIRQLNTSFILFGEPH